MELTKKEIIILNSLFKAFHGYNYDLGRIEKYLLDVLHLPENLSFELAYLYHKNFDSSKGDFSNVSEPKRMKYLGDFHEKIRQIISNGSINPNDVFDSKIDKIFYLYVNWNTPTPTIYFKEEGIEFEFGSNDEGYIDKILNLSQDQLSYYYEAINGGGYTSDGEYDEDYLISMLDDSNLNILKDILIICGFPHLSKILFNREISTQDAVKIFSSIDKILPKNGLLDEMRSELIYTEEVASANSVKTEFRAHFPKGINYTDSRKFDVSYDYFLDFLNKNKNVQTFSDLLNYPLIGYDLYLEDAYFNYHTEMDFDDYNKSIYHTLNNLYNELEDNDELSKNYLNVEKFLSIIKDLKFSTGNKYYIKKIKNKLIRIQFDDINYVDQIATVVVTEDKKNRVYKIPFDEISNYVLSNQLYENVKILISESQYNMLCEEKEEFFVPRRTREEREKFWRAAIYKQIQRYIKNGSTGNLDLDKTPVLLLPDNLTRVGGNLDLYRCTKITKLPDNLTYVGGYIDLSYTPITKLPDNLTIGGDLWLGNNGITEIPKNLRIGRNLWLRNTPLNEKYTEDQISDIITKSGGPVSKVVFNT